MTAAETPPWPPPEVAEEARRRASIPAVFSAFTVRSPRVASTVERSTEAAAPPRTTLVAARPLAAITLPSPGAVPAVVPAGGFEANEAPPEAVTVVMRVAAMLAASLAETVRSAPAFTVASVTRAVAPPFTSLKTIRPPIDLEDEAGVRAVEGGVTVPFVVLAGVVTSDTLSIAGITALAAAGIQLSLV
ncbi:hypothetical protein CHKEEEPN_1637 [Methylorubrum podarium]|nr:hypothetical protein CHKEEEPN_1637 [Methylorubrum podarium]